MPLVLLLIVPELVTAHLRIRIWKYLKIKRVIVSGTTADKL